MGLPSGSSSWICLPPGPTSISLRKRNAGLAECRDAGGKVLHAQHDPVPAARLLALSIGHRARTRSIVAAQQNLELAERHCRESRQLLMLQLEAQLLGIEIYGACDVADLIANAVKHGCCCLLGHDLGSSSRKNVTSAGGFPAASTSEGNGIWWRGRDSNPRPRHYECHALTS